LIKRIQKGVPFTRYEYPQIRPWGISTSWFWQENQAKRRIYKRFSALSSASLDLGQLSACQLGLGNIFQNQ
jgi:hypothetical protein